MKDALVLFAGPRGKMSEKGINVAHRTIGSLVAFAAPTIFMMLFSGLYTLVDTICIVRLVGSDALSAVNIVTPVINLIVGLGSMLASGGSAIVARKFGERNEKEARQDFSFIVFVGFVFGIAIALSGNMFMDSIVSFLGAAGVLKTYAAAYLSLLILFAPANILQTLFSFFLITAGRPKLGFSLVAVAGTMNACLDFLFMGPFGMGIRGAALATGIGYLVPAVGGVVFFLHGTGSELYITRFRRDFRLIAESCGNGASELVGQLSVAVTTFLFNGAMLRLVGVDGVAAITIIIYAQFLLDTLFIGFSMGVVPLVSYAFGKKAYGEVKQLVWHCIGFIAVASISAFLLALCCGSSVTGLFVPEGSAVYGIAKTGFSLIAWAFLFSGLNIFASAFFTALGDAKCSMIISLLRSLVLLAFGIIVLPHLFDFEGIWLSLPFAEAGTFVVSVSFLRWKMNLI
jgi:putative MATE family efflux protein